MRCWQREKHLSREGQVDGRRARCAATCHDQEWLNDPISRLFVRQQAAEYEDWYRSARLGLLDHQTDWYYTPAEDEDKVTVIILNTGACQQREIIQSHPLWEHFTDCHGNLSGRCGTVRPPAACRWKPWPYRKDLSHRLNYTMVLWKAFISLLSCLSPRYCE